jgi:hypothetical protein
MYGCRKKRFNTGTFFDNHYIIKWAGVRKIYVPQVGLADGIVHILYEKYKTSRPETSNVDNLSIT